MNACCGLDLRVATKIIAVASAIICGLVIIACTARLTSSEPETLIDIMGISAAVVYLAFGAVLYSGAVQSAAGRCEAWIAAGLILCGFQVHSISNTIQNWEHTGMTILLIDVVSVVLLAWFVIVVFAFIKQIKESHSKSGALNSA